MSSLLTVPATPRRRFTDAARSTLRDAQPHLLITLAALFLVVGLHSDTFLTPPSLGNLANSMAFLGFVALGETVLLLAGEFDLSVGAVSGLAAVVSAQAMTSSHWPVALGVLVALLVGATAGAVNGVVTAVFGVPSFISTFGMASIASAIGLFITRGESVAIPQPLVDLGALRLMNPFGFSVMLLVFLALAAATGVFLVRTAAGRAVYATGGDPAVARLAGIRVRRVKISAFVFTGLLAGLAGLLQAAAQSTALSTTGASGVELEAVAAAIIGGTSILGGAGTVLGTVIGLAVLETLKLGLVTLGVPINWQSLAVGAIIVAAIAADVTRRRHTSQLSALRPSGVRRIRSRPSSTSTPTEDSQ
ncbi:ABC transporter permease [Nonomuraea sp. H19]|uniref:ABC transporter permease n=1 Tax=Nonomuraea sp. H19 TaxID=3452206 RepID=UPI003F8C8CEF